MAGIGFINPVTKAWQDHPVQPLRDGTTLKAAFDPDLKRHVMIDGENWNTIRNAITAGRRDFQEDPIKRKLALSRIANSLESGAEFQTPEQP